MRGKWGLLLLVWVAIFTTGCGFSLNRQRQLLPNGASLIAFGEVENKTFFPGLDLRLRQGIEKKLATQKLIHIVPIRVAEQILSLRIISNKMEKEEFSKEEEGLVQYVFTVKGAFALFETKSQSYLFKDHRVSATYTVKMYQIPEPDHFEIQQGYFKALQSLSNQIYESLTNEF